MTEQLRTIADGFGGRLREVREGAGLTQTQLADAGGVKRMAQAQYEKEIRSPTVKYLAAVAAQGLDLHYVLFGRRAELPLDEQRALEKRVFDFIEQYARQQPGGQLGAEARFTMFELLRTSLMRGERGGVATSFETGDLISVFQKTDA